jgi:hypothetical protein
MSIAHGSGWLRGMALLLPLVAAQAATRPTVVELYTSEGCSSCPPADEYLGELARRPDVLALSFHVDYWDDLGWRDALALSSSTSRQRRYAHQLGLASIFTPQAILDGRESFVGSDRIGIAPRLARSTVTVPLALSRERAELIVDVGLETGAIDNDIVLIPFRREVVIPVARGENRGRVLREFNVARELRLIGHTSREPQQLHVPIGSLPKDATDVAVLAQRPAQGPIVGAARLDLTSAVASSL